MIITVTDQLTANHCLISSRFSMKSAVVTQSLLPLENCVCYGPRVNREMLPSNAVGNLSTACRSQLHSQVEKRRNTSLKDETSQFQVYTLCSSCVNDSFFFYFYCDLGLIRDTELGFGCRPRPNKIGLATRPILLLDVDTHASCFFSGFDK